MKLTLTCDCGNAETIEVNQRKMSDYSVNEDMIFIDDIEKNNKFSHSQSHPDESTISCRACHKSIELTI